MPKEQPLKHNFSQALLDAMRDAFDHAVLASDRTGSILWRTADCKKLDAALAPGGVLSPASLMDQVPGTGDVLLDDGRTIRWHAQLLPRPLPLADPGRPTVEALLWTFEDQTHTERLRRALDDAEGRLRLLSPQLHGIIFELDAQVRIVRVWTSDPGLLAVPEQALLGRTILEILGPEVGRQHHEAALATVRFGKSARYEYELDVPEGHRHFATESIAVSAIDSDEQHAIFWIRDITEQVQIQQRLLETERLASIGTLAAGLAHEINNPLAYMMLNTGELRAEFRRLASDPKFDGQLDGMKASVEMIYEGAHRVQCIVHDLLQLAKPVGQVGPVDVRQVITMATELTRTSWENRARLRTEWDDVPRVSAHQGCLVQVFTNLLTNAAQAIAAGAIADNAITVSVCQPLPNSVQIEFRDSGMGIAEEDAAHIFEPFFTTKQQGTGLGLAICQMVVRSFDGEIQFERGQSRGSVFRVLLPVAE
ncbi:MAG: ATP-binding protein [Myxococcota bacterium]|nr:ATP-binding protein [Myxococcota bacterium]